MTGTAVLTTVEIVRSTAFRLTLVGYFFLMTMIIFHRTLLLLFHNLLFEETSYQLIGFSKRGEDLQAALKQSFVISDAPVDLSAVKEFLEFNGFLNTRRNDYYNKQLGLILEDIHDENVIMNSGIMFFIDTVFYIDVEHK